MPRRAKSPSLDQIRRETARLHAIKGAALRDMKALRAMGRPKEKRAEKPPAQGIKMGS